ncbi:MULTISPECIES: sigma-70 family RNA polymerase sigma factor [unclassified Nocardioides]|uniref:sigma-70 family RNA polymerase sigma factor n=1 Tax=unclassified Nocardioides TaxID=2615069 RepID=UPI000A26DBFB|nr:MULTISPECIES: sigma-70 family RNA polymerase sigma factor [unclassified Nocardioides]
MRDPDEFDQFYKDVRTRLLLLTYCLTGDLPSSRAAVRDAFVVTWHHWRKVSRLEDPEAWTRARACSHAQRRHTAKLWHREKGLDPEVKTTLDALGKLPVTQRRVLLLSELSTASLAELSREVGLPRTEAERALQTATAQFALLREIPTTSIRTVLDPVRAHVEDSTWSRATIIRRAGAARRRTHTVVGVAASVAALVLTGTLVTDAAGVRPTLSGERMEAADRPEPSAEPTPEPIDLPEEAMLTAEQVAQHVPGKDWTVTSTDDNTAGDGLVMPCQDERYADPKGPAALVRTFDPQAPKPTVTTLQTSQASESTKAASRSYATMLDWFAGCSDDRAQLLQTRSVDGVGDEAMVLSLRLWDEPTSAVVVGVARTGQFTTATMTRITGKDDPGLVPSAKLLGAAISDLCTLPEAGSCPTGRTSMRKVPPVPVADVPAILAEVDLPPVTGVDQPWVGTEPRQAKDNVAATGCDQADFSAMTNDVTRTFLIPKAKLADQFGLTETLGSLPEAKAAAFVADVRDKLAKCSQRQMGTQVERVRHLDGKHLDVSVWHLTTEVTDKLTVSFWMGIVRDGTSIAQVGFVPDKSVGMSSDAFNALVGRALARLDAMPPPKSG